MLGCRCHCSGIVVERVHRNINTFVLIQEAPGIFDSACRPNRMTISREVRVRRRTMTHEAPVTPQNCAMFSSISFIEDFDLLDLDYAYENKKSDLDMNPGCGASLSTQEDKMTNHEEKVEDGK
jgi:hypothetical protein